MISTMIGAGKNIPIKIAAQHRELQKVSGFILNNRKQECLSASVTFPFAMTTTGYPKTSRTQYTITRATVKLVQLEQQWPIAASAFYASEISEFVWRSTFS